MKNLMSIAEHSDWLEVNYTTSQTKWHLHRLRIEFGKQPLEIYQLIPCKLVNGVWVILEDPFKLQNGEKVDESYPLEMIEYQEAKECCLFEGFTFNEASYILSCADNVTIEDITSYKPKLTATAKKQIGL